MRYLKWGFWLTLLAIVLSFLHYTLPQHDIVRIVGTENRRVDIGSNSIFWSGSEAGMVNSTSRDVYFINAVYPNGKTIEYRNEDTGWGWPPYFKFDSSGLNTEAKELTSTQAAPVWVSVTHYGWRNKFFTIFPNAVGMKQVEGPDATIIPWVNIILLIVFLTIAFTIRRVWLQFRERTIDPALDDVSQSWEALDARADAARSRAVGRWARFKNWFKRK